MAQVDWYRVNVGDSIATAITNAQATGGVVYLVPGEHTIAGTLQLDYPWTPPPPRRLALQPAEPGFPAWRRRQYDHHQARGKLGRPAAPRQATLRHNLWDCL